MRKLAIAVTLATTILGTPAVARDGAPYIGIEGGGLIVEDTDFDYEDESGSTTNAITVDHSVGYDVDLIGGFDLGAVRLEAELAHKRAGVNGMRFKQQADIVADPLVAAGVDADGRVSILSAMGNALLDFGDDDGWRGYVGLGAGLARVKFRAFTEEDAIGFVDEDRALAYQVIAGASAPLTPNLDLGLKYRFFNTRRLNFGGADAEVPFALEGKLRTHSLLASLVYNFWSPAPPAPVVVEAPLPPPPPATQTCPDGSVILATDVCPVPPPPPPAPPGERG